MDQQTPSLYPDLPVSGATSSSADHLLEREMSQTSRQTLEVLQDLATQYNQLVDRTNEVERHFRSGEWSGGHATTQLSQVEAAANKLQEKGVDSVQIAELHWGKKTARALRRSLNNGLESFFERLTGLFKDFRELPPGAAAPGRTSAAAPATGKGRFEQEDKSVSPERDLRTPRRPRQEKVAEPSAFGHGPSYHGRDHAGNELQGEDHTSPTRREFARTDGRRMPADPRAEYDRERRRYLEQQRRRERQDPFGLFGPWGGLDPYRGRGFFF